MLSQKSRTSRLVFAGLGVIIPCILLILPLSSFPVREMTITQQRMIAIFVFAAVFWITEPIPPFVTSVVIIILELLMISNKGLVFFRTPSEHLGTLVSYKPILSVFAAPIIILFIGGFFLAIALDKYKLNYKIAKTMLKPFGEKTENVLLGIMLITALFSMFMSNTATTAMMISILLPVLSTIPSEDRSRAGFALAIPFAANIGGMGTPIGTPPNAIAVQALNESGHGVSFATWMSFGVPIVIIMIFVVWRILLLLFPPNIKNLSLDFRTDSAHSGKHSLVYITFLLTVFLWLTGRWHGMNSYVVAMIPVGIFLLSGVIDKEDLGKLNWDVLWLFAGGVALGLGLSKTGTATNIIQSFNLSAVSFGLIIIVFMSVIYILSNFMSNTAATNLIVPIAMALVVSLGSLPGSEIKSLIILVGLSASLSMILPISTPPNALGFGTGFIRQKDMALSGLIIGVIGLVFLYFYMKLISGLHIF